ncbi:MAG: phage portal protein [Bradyrhizobium sp.]|nr:MAG: phage portal protein [Bradyrhizobium sp.]
MSDAARETPLPPSLIARLAVAARYAISGVSPDAWFGPQQPLTPQAPPEVKGRQFDYPFGVNLSYIPRTTGGVSFAELRALADALPLLRTIIETRKDQVAALSHTVRPCDPSADADAAARAKVAAGFLACPDRRHSFSAWLRMLLEDMLVIDAATLYPRVDRAGRLYSLDVIDGATITPLIGEDGRAPEPPDPAYQQVLHGVPAADFSADELLYLPRNIRAHKLYGFSPVEQIALTVNIALRREAATLDYYRSGSTPDAFATLPKEWTVDQIRQFQDYFDALMSGNSARRRMTKFMPADFRLIEARQPPLKDQYDEWLARAICYAFSVPASAFVSQVNRATGETLRLQAAQEGLVPLKAWIKAALDHVIQICLDEPDLEFVWVGDDAVDPLQQAQTLNILVGAGIKTIAEARAELGLATQPKPEPKIAPGGQPEPAGFGKFNPYHDERGRFTTADDAVEPGAAQPRSATRPKGVQVATESEPPEEEPKPEGAEEGKLETYFNPDTGRTATVHAGSGVELKSPWINLRDLQSPTYLSAPEAASEPGTIAEAVAPNGVLPGEPRAELGSPRTMPASDDPDAAAAVYILRAYNGQQPISVRGGWPDMFIAEMPNGAFITFRPAGQASAQTLSTTATVEINDPVVNALNGDRQLKLKFPRN